MGTRDWTGACIDALAMWYLSCSVYRSAGLDPPARWEAPIYYDALTPVQQCTYKGLFDHYDRVCHPYTYYFPTETPAADSPAGDSPAEDSGAVLAGSWIFTALAVVAP